MKVSWDRSSRIPRIWSNKILKRISHNFDGDIINISGWKDDDKEGNNYSKYFINSKSYTISNYRGQKGISNLDNEIFIDLEADLDKNMLNRFDVCFNHTTLEHIYNFQKAFENICLMSKDIVILILPFSQELHETESYGDYWRFTPSSIKKMFEKNNLKVIMSLYNNHRNAGIYTFTVASKNPEKWDGLLSNYKRNSKRIGYWIGQSLVKMFVKRIITSVRNNFLLKKKK